MADPQGPEPPAETPAEHAAAPEGPRPPDAPDAAGGEPAAPAPPTAAPDQRRGVLRRVLQILASILLFMLVLFGLAGTWHWVEAWLLIGVFVGCTLAAALVFTPRHPEVVAARSRMHSSEAPRWDRWFAVAYSLLSVAVPAVAGLEYRLRGPGDWPIALVLLGVLAFALAYGLALWAMASNPFFETLVRIQRERGHVTVSSGPYAYVRHPGYVGILIIVMSMALILRSAWALVPALACCAVVIARTALEDRFLQAQLEGYAAYAGRVRYRLVPGVW